MKIINQFLQEFSPKNPDDIVIKNKFYPNGLSERSIYNYYMSRKRELLEWIGDRNVSFLLRLSENQTVIIRNQKGKPILLTSDNFEKLITGRTNVVYVSHPKITDYWIIDIDLGPNLKMFHAKKTLEILLHELRLVDIADTTTKKFEAITSSPQGIHLIGYLNVSKDIDLLRNSLKIELERIVTKLNVKSKIEFTVNVKGKFPNKINLDLSSMHPGSLHIAKHSLTKEFLVCGDVTKSGLKKIHT